MRKSSLAVSWMETLTLIVKIDINKSSVKFKIDMGADVTVLQHTVFQENIVSTNQHSRRQQKLGPGISPQSDGCH